MGCDDSKVANKEVVYLVGFPSSGKTFTGDYLATRGWCHVDGDMGNQTDDVKVREKFGKLAGKEMTECMMEGKPVPTSLWHPYFLHLIGEVKKALKKCDKVVLSFAVCGMFGGEEELMRKHFPNIKFIYVQCDKEILVERFYQRNIKQIQESGMTMEEMWKMEMMADTRAMFGEEYSEEAYKAMSRAHFFDMPMITLEHCPEKNIWCVQNDDLTKNQAICEVNKILGLSD